MSQRAPALDVAGRGHPLVLLHGLATTRGIWVGVVPRLARTRRVVTLDIPGFGIAPPAGRGFALAGVADRVHAEVRAARLGGPVDLVGHSMGAAVALALAARHPDAVRSLVLVSPAGLRPLPFALAAGVGIAAELYIPVRRRAAPLAAYGWGRRLLMAGGVVDGAALHPAVVRQLVGASLGARRIGPALTAVARADLRATLSALPMPVGALWGSGDRVIPPGGLQTVLAIRPDAVCEVIEGAGHISMIERPAAFAAALDRVLVAITTAPRAKTRPAAST
jgi:pimeloyl-ACP methyl ester carboxylesterase